MKKSLKKLLLIGSTLGAAGVVAGSVALSSCSVNIWKNADGSITISDEAKPSTNVDSESGNESGTNSVETNKNHKDENHHENKHDDKHDSNVSIQHQQQENANLQQLINEHKTNDELIAQAKENGLSVEGTNTFELSVNMQTSVSSLTKSIKSNDDGLMDEENQSINIISLTISQNSNEATFGKISFINDKNEEVNTISAVPGQEIKIKATPNSDYTLVDLAVFDASTNNTLGVTQENNSDIYKFTLPQPTLPNGEPNPFYSTGNLKIIPTFAKKQLNDFIYDFNSHAYVLNINENSYTFDDVANSKLKLTSGNKDRNIQYRIYLNGHDLTIKNLTVPENAQLMFINNINNSNDDNNKIPTVKLADNTYMFGPSGGNCDKITVKGAIGRYGSVQYGKRMADYFEPHWAGDIPEMPKN